jgi:hypothetical protein
MLHEGSIQLRNAVPHGLIVELLFPFICGRTEEPKKGKRLD